MGTAVLNSSKTPTTMLEITKLDGTPWSISEDKQKRFEAHYEKESSEDRQGRSYTPEEFKKDREFFMEYRRWRQVVKTAAKVEAQLQGRDV